MNDHPPALEDGKKLAKALRVKATLGFFRELSREMPVQQILVFLWVAQNNGGLQRNLSRELGMTRASVSRSIDALSDKRGSGSRGLGLIRATEAASDRRDRELFLTESGQFAAREVLALFSGKRRSGSQLRNR